MNDVLPGLHDVEMIFEPYRLSSSFATRIFPILLCPSDTLAVVNQKHGHGLPVHTAPSCSVSVDLGA